MNPRAIAATLLIQVIKDQRSLTEVLSSLSQDHPNLIEPGLVKALCYETLRWYFQLQTLLDRLTTKPLKSKDEDIKLLIMVGLCQILFFSTASHVAVAQTVSAVDDLKKSWAKKLVNAVLRNFLREKESLVASLNSSPASLHAHPNWLIKRLKKAYPDQWESILAANNEHPPLSLRINLCKTSRAAFLEKLSLHKIDAFPSTLSNAGITLTTPRDILTIPGFSSGLFSVQDIAPQLAPTLLDLKKNHLVLDACAAPGGKTMHILETEPEIARLTALDVSESRLEKAQETWRRLALPDKVTWIAEDAEKVNVWWDGKCFDRILLDAPCSATGVIRRHPDIKILRKSEDIAKLAIQQLKLLNALWDTLKPGGILIYATCSVLPEENSEVVQAFLEQHENAFEDKIQTDWGESNKTIVGKQILPGNDNMDGFYYAKLFKK